MEIGDIIICIDDNFPNSRTSIDFKELPKRGITYTIRDARPLNAEGGILLNEVINPPIYFTYIKGYLEPAFARHRFVKINDLDRVFEEEKTKEVILN